MVDLRISKTLNRGRTLEGQTVTAGQNLSVDLHGARLERIGTKSLLKIERGISRSRFATKDPITILSDYKKITEVIRIKGHIDKATWADAEADMVKLIIIFQDGGTFTLTHRDRTHTVNIQQYMFIIEAGKQHDIEYTIDLVKGQERT